MSDLEIVSFSKRKASEPRLSEPYRPGRSNERYWSEAERDVVRRFYETKGAAYCGSLLPGRPLRSVYAQANKMELKATTVSHRPRFRPARPDQYDCEIKEAWPTLVGRGAVSAFADRLGIPRHFLTVRATRLGLTMPHRKEPPWSADEDALMARIPLHDVHRAANIFREHGFFRTPTAIMVRAKRLELSRRYNETFSATSAAKVLGIDAKAMSTFIFEGRLKAERRGTRRLSQQGGDTWSITRGSLRQFVIVNLERIDFRKVDKFQLVDLLTNTLSVPENLPAIGGTSEAAPEHCTQHDAHLVSSAVDLSAELVRGAPNPRPPEASATRIASQPFGSLRSEIASDPEEHLCRAAAAIARLERRGHVVVRLASGRYLVDGMESLAPEQLAARAGVASAPAAPSA